MSFSRQDVIAHLESCGHQPYRRFIDLSHPYLFCATARLHLFADAERWAMVCETVVWGQRSMRVELVTASFGNCLRDLRRVAEGRFESNSHDVELITQAEQLRLLSNDQRVRLPVGRVQIRDGQVPGPPDRESVRGFSADASAGLQIQELMRWLAAHHPQYFHARESELRAHLPPDLPALLTLDEWHHRQYSVYRDRPVGDLPSSYETYPMLAVVLETRDPTRYRPTLPPNSHWSNWPEQGSL
jgi:hypothetical protein